MCNRGCTIAKEARAPFPTVLEADGRAERAFDLYSRLLRDRIVFLGRPVGDELANLIVGQFLFLEAEDPEKDIALYVNSPGGEVYAGLAIYDAMQHVRPDVQHDLLRHGDVAAAVISPAAPREAVRAAERETDDPSGDPPASAARQPTSIAAREIVATTRQMAEIIAQHSAARRAGARRHRPRPFRRRRHEAVEYGLVDAVLVPHEDRPSSIAA